MRQQWEGMALALVLPRRLSAVPRLWLKAVGCCLRSRLLLALVLLLLLERRRQLHRQPALQIMQHTLGM
jgi:hypothetical protein